MGNHQADLATGRVSRSKKSYFGCLPSSASICSTGGASSSECSGSDSTSALMTSAFFLFSTRALPSQPLLSRGEDPLRVGGDSMGSTSLWFSEDMEDIEPEGDVVEMQFRTKQIYTRICPATGQTILSKRSLEAVGFKRAWNYLTPMQSM